MTTEASGEDNLKSIYDRGQFGTRLGFGKKPALIVVDLIVGFTRLDKSPLGGELGDVIKTANRVIGAARSNAIPIFFSVEGFNQPEELGLWLHKVPGLRILQLGTELTEIDARVDKRPEDIVVIKKYASVFFGTPLQSTLTAARIDTVVLTGCTTSGCIRATAEDAISMGFRPVVVLEAVGDRAREPHESNLFDMAMKCADVLPEQEVIEYLTAG